jgi:phage shock protein PspC (stress-responsive transcriptional regulator)/phenylpyruvate tautomerase PptA (4-oxalocrotonate tautomerase family)
MKKTLTINLNNIVFHIDDDAYEMLQTYLKDVEKHLSEEEKKEVMADIEARIAEIFNESLKRNKTVINIEDVEEIIAVLGNPSQYADENEATEEKNTQQQNTGNKNRSRRYYRDPENAVLGGVAAGISAYFGWDVTWVRIALVILVLIGWGTAIPIYLVVWLIAPKAVTVSQRLEMQGEDVTVENIKSEINNVKNYVESDKFKQSASGFGEKFLEIVRVLVKVFVGFIGAILGFVGIVVAITLVFVLGSLLFVPEILSGLSPELAAEWSTMTGDNTALLVISLLLVIGAPIFMIIYWAMNLINRRHYEYSKTTSLVTLLLWLSGLFMLYSVGAKSIINWTNNNGEHFVINWDEKQYPSVDEARTYEAFTSLDVSDNIEVELIHDSLKQMVVSAPEKVLSQVKTEVNNGRLRIYTDKFLLNYPVKVTLSVDSLYELEASGASKITTLGSFTTTSFKLDLSGASQAKLELFVSGNTDVELSGASFAEFVGSGNKLNVDASGASKLKAELFRTKNAVVQSSGAAHSEVYATESIDADASGAGEIDVTGNPKDIKRSENMGASVRVK